MSSTVSPSCPLDKLVRAIRNLSSEVSRKHAFSKVPEIIQELKEEVRRLESVANQGQSLNLDWAQLKGPHSQEATHAIQDGLRLMRELLNLVNEIDSISWEEFTEKVGSGELKRYKTDVKSCLDILSNALNFTQLEQLQRLLVCVQDADILKYFQSVNEDLGDTFAVGYSVTDQSQTVRKTDIPQINNSNPLGDITSLSKGVMRMSMKSSLTVLPKAKCRTTCRCRCHETSKYPLPFKFKKLFKRLFFNTQNEVVLVSKCSISRCRAERSIYRRIFVVVNSAIISKVVILAAISRGLIPKLDIKSYPVVQESSDIVQSAQTGNLELMKKLIYSNKATVNDVCSDGWSILHSAAYFGRHDVVYWLVKVAKANTNVGEINLRKASHFAKFRSLTKSAGDNEKQIAKLFDDESDFKYDFDLSPIMCTLLGEYDEDDLERPNLASIIQFAKELCDSPIDYDWNLARREFRDRSPLYLDILAIFKQAGKTTGARLGAFYNLMNLGDALQCWSPLQWAAYTDCTPEFVMLIENGANAFELTPSLRNIIHQATEPGTQGALAYLIEHNYHHRGVDINLKDRWGETPLHIACERSSISASMLLQQGANSKIRQEDGQVPLHYVKRLNHQDCINCAKILLEIEDPPINWQDSSGKTPLFYVLGIPECVDLFVKSGADIGLLDNQGMSVLHHACIENGHEALKILLRNLPNDASATVDELGRTPLQLCFDLYRPICALILLEETTVELVVDKNGWSLAHHAVKMGNEHVLERILRIDRNLLHSKTNNGESLIDLARKYGKLNSGIGEVLRKAMRLNPDEFAEFDRRIPSSFEILSMVR